MFDLIWSAVWYEVDEEVGENEVALLFLVLLRLLLTSPRVKVDSGKIRGDPATPPLPSVDSVDFKLKFLASAKALSISTCALAVSQHHISNPVRNGKV